MDVNKIIDRLEDIALSNCMNLYSKAIPNHRDVLECVFFSKITGKSYYVMIDINKFDFDDLSAIDLELRTQRKPKVLYNTDINSFYPVEHEVFEYCKKDAKAVLNMLYGSRNMKPQIEKVIFNDPATIVFWSDGTKTVVKAQGDDAFDPEKGLAMAISKKFLGNNHDYYEVFQKHVGRYEKQQRKKKGYETEFSDAVKAMRKLSDAFKKFNT